MAEAMYVAGVQAAHDRHPGGPETVLRSVSYDGSREKDGNRSGKANREQVGRGAVAASDQHGLRTPRRRFLRLGVRRPYGWSPTVRYFTFNRVQ